MNYLGKALVAITAMLGLSIGSAVAATTSFEAMWVIGDSLSDTGNLFKSSGNTFPSNALGYANGRLSNGTLWVEHVAAGLGLPALTPGFNQSFTAGNNLAVAGARTDTTNSLGAFADGSGMRSQVNGFSTFYRPALSNTQVANSLFVVAAAGNDVTLWTDTSDLGARDAVIQQSMTNLDGLIRDLHTAGAQSFLVPNFPGVIVPDDWSPQFAVERMTNFAPAYNNELASLMTNLRTDLGVTIYEVDFHALFQELLTDTTDSISNVTAPCLDLSAVGAFQGACGNPDAFPMYDALHPTAATHQLMGATALSAIPLPATLPLLSAALGGLFWRLRASPQRKAL